jgi:hypothetical protein
MGKQCGDYESRDRWRGGIDAGAADPLVQTLIIVYDRNTRSKCITNGGDAS